jgi:hypothetical protein
MATNGVVAENSIESYLESQQGAISYSWLARELCCPASEARDYLSAYAKKHSKLLVHYLVCGTSPVGGASPDASASTYVVSIVPASGLEGLSTSRVRHWRTAPSFQRHYRP